MLNCVTSHSNMHNNLRITRILKSLGELGFKHYQAPLVRFFLEETLVKKTLSSVKRSVLDYFLFAVLDRKKRQELVRFAYLHFEPKEKFVWCPRKIQKHFKKTEKKTDAVGNGDGKDELYSQGKGGEAVMQQKQDGLDETTKAQKETDKTANKEKNKQADAPPEPEPDTDIVGNGNAKAESNDEILGNGNDSAADDGEMELSPSSDNVAAINEPGEFSQPKLTNNSRDIIQEPGNMQTDELDAGKPPKKKRDDTVLTSNGDSTTRLMEETSGANEATGQTSPSVQTPHKASTHSPSLSSGKGEKIPRTEFNQVPNKEKEDDALQDSASATTGADKSVDEQKNGQEMGNIALSSEDQNMGNS